MFGGIGQNFVNPALAARCFLLVAWAAPMTNFTVDGIAGATPLGITDPAGLPSIMSCFLGTIPGCDRGDVRPVDSAGWGLSPCPQGHRLYSPHLLLRPPYC